MTHLPHPLTTFAAGAATTLAAVALALPASAATTAPTHPTKAQVEHAEATSVPTHSTKAQIEHAERSATRPAPTTVSSSHATTSSDGNVALWQLAASALLGAGLTGLGVAGARHLGHERPATT